MYSAPNGIWVPVGNVTWGYNAVAINPSGKGYRYTSLFLAGPTYATTYVASVAYPSWMDSSAALLPNDYKEYLTN